MESMDPLVKELGIIAEKQMKSILHSKFLNECQNENVIPKGLRLKLKVSVGTDSGDLQKSIDELLERVSFDICERIRDFHLRKAHSYSQMIEDKRKQIQKIVSDDKLSRIYLDIYRMTEEKKDYLVLRHKKKLSSLKGMSSSSNNPAETNIRSTPFKNSTSADSNIPSNEWQQVTTKRKGKNKRRNEKREKKHLRRYGRTRIIHAHQINKPIRQHRRYTACTSVIDK